ncbi:hypothetical protein PSU4_01830 [Pseudonocardia sulfidoxydans NBRC 16205]|uniref:Branched-chain amino acid ABC transporter permease n=1 Tax=Pseudonocardia sulfidoxydans NBRC 16205 TaxID=1223511 RepID=A0A511D8U9_9PSEU|nr:branched-chain amino acid ABC transporter permease [Pseudonocardia sulfidoxydans]GEL21229.1 hypothetical protein PSU4_01830 [Pseudonocardia sulfidoxydans NBRC 16205]
MRGLVGPVVGALACGAVLAWSAGSGYAEGLVALGATYSLLALGMWVPFVLGGSLSMAYSVYLAVGGYVVGFGILELGWPLLPCLLVGIVIAVLVAVALGAATRRLSGFYLAAVTLLAAAAFEAWLLDATGLTGGSTGLRGIPLTAIGSLEITRWGLLVTAVVLTWVVAVLFDRLRSSNFGVALRAQRHVPAAVQASGIGTQALSLVGQGLGAAVAALGGAFFAAINSGVGPETFTPNLVFLAIFMPLIGGVRTAWGAVLGAALVVVLTVYVHLPGDAGSLVLSLAALVILLLWPNGLLGQLRAGVDRLSNTLRGGAS